MDQGLMLIDGDCGFCVRTGRLVPRLGLRVRVSTVQGTDLPAYGVDAERAVAEMPWLPGGTPACSLEER